ALSHTIIAPATEDVLSKTSFLPPDEPDGTGLTNTVFEMPPADGVRHRSEEPRTEKIAPATEGTGGPAADPMKTAVVDVDDGLIETIGTDADAIGSCAAGEGTTELAPEHIPTGVFDPDATASDTTQVVAVDDSAKKKSTFEARTGIKPVPGYELLG